MVRLAALCAATATHAADPASSLAANPLYLPLPCDVVHWAGVAFRLQQLGWLEVDPGVLQEKALTTHARMQPYGTGFEARMSREGFLVAPGAASAGSQGAAASPAAARGDKGKGR
jgi:hypothetical protein